MGVVVWPRDLLAIPQDLVAPLHVRCPGHRVHDMHDPNCLEAFGDPALAVSRPHRICRALQQAIERADDTGIGQLLLRKQLLLSLASQHGLHVPAFRQAVLQAQHTKCLLELRCAQLTPTVRLLDLKEGRLQRARVCPCQGIADRLLACGQLGRDQPIRDRNAPHLASLRQLVCQLSLAVGAQLFVRRVHGCPNAICRIEQTERGLQSSKHRLARVSHACGQELLKQQSLQFRRSLRGHVAC
mmetsp:Transcript_20571/g.56794  ORF Transcript_20571/g.56794 Transcript_20571/m.56794 type:complete len:242 (-) Transcript_20571:865-1590(-)